MNKQVLGMLFTNFHCKDEIWTFYHFRAKKNFFMPKRTPNYCCLLYKTYLVIHQCNGFQDHSPTYFLLLKRSRSRNNCGNFGMKFFVKILYKARCFGFVEFWNFAAKFCQSSSVKQITCQTELLPPGFMSSRYNRVP